MVDNKKGMLLNHNDVLAAWKEDYYRDLITEDHLGDEAVIKYKENKLFIYPVKYKKKTFAIPSEKIVEAGKLPIKITTSDKCAYGLRVYHVVNKFATARIRDDRAMSFRGMVDAIANFEHTTKDTEYLVYKITTIMLYLRKGFARVVSPPAFGKNSIPEIIKELMRDVAVINPRTTAAFEHKLVNKMVVLDELTNLSKAQRDTMQEALLRVCGGGNTYEKGTRGSVKIGTKDEYNIGYLSVLILYNTIECYDEAGQADKYFDLIFQKAVKSRLLPLYFEGILPSMQFANVDKPREIAAKYKEDIIKIVRALKHYLKNLETYDTSGFKHNKKYILSEDGRHDKTFHLICQGLRLYSKTNEEYNQLTEILYNAYIRYIKMASSNEIEEVPLEPEVEVVVKEDEPKEQKTLV